MQFMVPQFIDVETKIIGPISPRQFIIIIFTVGFILLAYKLSDFTLFLIEAVTFLTLGGILAFFKVNGQPVHLFLLNIVSGIKKPGLRVWKKVYIPVVEKGEKKKKKEAVVVLRKPLEISRLSNIALMVDTGGQYTEEELE